MRLCEVRLKMSFAKHSRTDGVSEVKNRIMENYLRSYCEHKQQNADQLLPTAETAYNSTLSDDLNSTLSKVDFGWRPHNLLDVLAGPRPRVQDVDDFLANLWGAFSDARYPHKLAKARQSVECGRHTNSPHYEFAGTARVSYKL